MMGAALVLIYGEYTRKIILVFLPMFVIAITILNHVYWKIAKVAAEYAYVRSYWNVPFYFLLACMIVSLISKMKRRKKIIIVVLALMVIIIGWGTSIAGISTGSDKFSNTQNIYKLPPEVVDIANCVQQDAGEEESLLYAPEEICMYIRECDANIGLLYHSWWKEMYTGFGAYEMIIDGEKNRREL